MAILLFPAIGQAALPGFMLERMGEMRGQIFVDDKPLAGAVVAFFHESKGLPPELGGMRRPPDFLSRLDGEGRFAIKLAAGRYYLGSLVRSPAQGLGPIQAGERFYVATDNAGKLRLLTIADRENLDLGRLDCVAPATVAGLALPAFFTVAGIVRYESGQPVAGAVVLAKERPEAPRPDYMAPRTGADGRFELKLPVAKSFYLMARENLLSARPLPGQRVGTLGVQSALGLAAPPVGGQGSGQPAGVHAGGQDYGNRPLTVTGSEGQKIEGIEIVMYPVPDPEAVKGRLQGTPGSPKLETENKRP